MLSSCVAPSCVIKEDPDSDVGKAMELCCVLLWAQLKPVRVPKDLNLRKSAVSAGGATYSCSGHRAWGEGDHETLRVLGHQIDSAMSRPCSTPRMRTAVRQRMHERGRSQKCSRECLQVPHIDRGRLWSA